MKSRTHFSSRIGIEENLLNKYPTSKRLEVVLLYIFEKQTVTILTMY